MPVRKLAAHGSFPRSNLTFVVPDHVNLHFLVGHGQPLENSVARFFDNKDLTQGFAAYKGEWLLRMQSAYGPFPNIPNPSGPGDEVQNYRLESLLGDIFNKPATNSIEVATGVWWTPLAGEETTLSAWVSEHAHLGSANDPLAVYCLFCRDDALEEEVVEVLRNPPDQGRRQRGRCCYVTTAVCEALGLGDDCRELELLRWYRDRVLLREPGGAAAVAGYYETAPRLVAEIDRSADPAAVYRRLYRESIAPAVAAVAGGDYPAARRIYEGMVCRIQTEFRS